MSTQTARPSAADSAKRRTQSLAGALTGVAIVVVLAVVFFVVKNDNSDKTPAAAQAPASAPAAEPAPADTPAGQETAGQPLAQPPAAAVPPELSKEPDVKAGQGAVSKLTVTPLIAGRGPAVQKGQTVTANYKVINYKTGQLIDSSWKTGQPFSTAIGVGQVIKGWDESIPGQKVGSRIQIDVPEALAYPGQGDLRFVVDILAAQ
jgi:peptidylprolyl isomerase